LSAIRQRRRQSRNAHCFPPAAASFGTFDAAALFPHNRQRGDAAKVRDAGRLFQYMSESNTNPAKLLKSRDIVAMLGINRNTFLFWLNSGQFPQPDKYLNRKSKWWKQSTLDAWLDARDVATPAGQAMLAKVQAEAPTPAEVAAIESATRIERAILPDTGIERR
jgi:predicted DNA-binding transcriptional regulator AlpA